MPNETPMRWHPEYLIPEDYKLYRLYRFGDAGKYGAGGVSLAASQHGVTVRAWFMYESGARRPKPPVRRIVAAWLTREYKRRPVSDDMDDGAPLPTDAPTTVDA